MDDQVDFVADDPGGRLCSWYLRYPIVRATYRGRSAINSAFTLGRCYSCPGNMPDQE